MTPEKAQLLNQLTEVYRAGSEALGEGCLPFWAGKPPQSARTPVQSQGASGVAGFPSAKNTSA